MALGCGALRSGGRGLVAVLMLVLLSCTGSGACPMAQDPNWAPKSPAELVQLAHVALVGLVEWAPGELARRRLHSYTATVRVLDVLKGEDTFRRVQRSRRLLHTSSSSSSSSSVSSPVRSYGYVHAQQQANDWVFNVSNYGSPQLCMSEVLAGRLYVLFLTCKPDCYSTHLPLAFSAQYHDVFGAAVPYAPTLIEHLAGALGFARWPLLSSCSAACLPSISASASASAEPSVLHTPSARQSATSAAGAQLGTLSRAPVCLQHATNDVCRSRDPNFDSLRACNRFLCANVLRLVGQSAARSLGETVAIARYFGAGWHLNETALLPFLQRSLMLPAEEQLEQQWVSVRELSIMWRMRVTQWASVAAGPVLELFALLDAAYAPRVWLSLAADAVELTFRVQPDLHGLPRAEMSQLTDEYLTGRVPVRLGPLPIRRNASHAVALALRGTRIELTFDGALRLAHEVPARLAFHMALNRARLAHWLLVIGNQHRIGGSFASGADIEAHLKRRTHSAPKLVVLEDLVISTSADAAANYCGRVSEANESERDELMSDEGAGLRPDYDGASASVSLRGLQSHNNQANETAAAAERRPAGTLSVLPLLESRPQTAANASVQRPVPDVTYTDMRGVARALGEPSSSLPSSSSSPSSHPPAARLNCSCTVLQCSERTRSATCAGGRCDVSGADAHSDSDSNPPANAHRQVSLRTCTCSETSESPQPTAASRTPESDILGAGVPPPPPPPPAIAATAQRNPCALASLRCESVCMNGGRCHIVDYGSRLLAQCACRLGFTGHHCEQRVCVEREILVTLAEDGGLVPYTICSTLSLSGNESAKRSLAQREAAPSAAAIRKCARALSGSTTLLCNQNKLLMLLLMFPLLFCMLGRT